MNRRRLMSDENKDDISLFQPVLYIEKPAAARNFIDLGVHPHNELGFKTVIAFQTPGANRSRYLMGQQDSLQKYIFYFTGTYCYVETNNKYNLGIGVAGNSTAYNAANTTESYRSKVMFNFNNSGKSRYLGASRTSVEEHGIEVSSEQGLTTLVLGCIRDTVNDSDSFIEGSYFFKVFDDGLIFSSGNNIIHGFMPCYRKSDNEVGLFDILNNKFHSCMGVKSGSDESAWINWNKGTDLSDWNRDIDWKI